MSDTLIRFSDRAADYAKYRPSYPLALLDDLDKTIWNRDSVVADIGAGTGIFTRLVAPRVFRVHACEPNGPMRDQGLADSAGFSNISWRPGTAESTGLAATSVDALVCAQAFHWFEPMATGIEWRRILKAEAQVVLVWNERDEGTGFQAGYEALLGRWCPDYHRVNHKNLGTASIEAFFSPGRVLTLTYRNDLHFDLEGLKGRLRSSSYCPKPGQPGAENLMSELESLFDRFREPGGRVTFPCQTKAYVGRLS